MESRWEAVVRAARPGRRRAGSPHPEGQRLPGFSQPASCPTVSGGPRFQALWGRDARPPCSLAREWPAWAPQGLGQQQAAPCLHGFMVAP